jgi:hypothetical protein
VCLHCVVLTPLCAFSSPGGAEGSSSTIRVYTPQKILQKKKNKLVKLGKLVKLVSLDTCRQYAGASKAWGPSARTGTSSVFARAASRCCRRRRRRETSCHAAREEAAHKATALALGARSRHARKGSPNERSACQRQRSAQSLLVSQETKIEQRVRCCSLWRGGRQAFFVSGSSLSR